MVGEASSRPDPFAEPPHLPDAGCYPNPGDSGVLWFWDGQRWSHPAPAPGWHDDPTEPGTSRYWSGSMWTRIRRPASRRARTAMLGLVTAGCVTLVWGFLVARENGAASYPPGYECTEAYIGDQIEGTWLPWLVLVALGVAGLIIWRKYGVSDPEMKTPAVLGVIAMIVTCPVLAMFILVLDSTGC
jgi:hypothetical protein